MARLGPQERGGAWREVLLPSDRSLRGWAALSAVIASIFGVKGTIVGVAIGSIAATTGTALVFQSIERTNKAVKQVVVRVPDNALVCRLGGTKTSARHQFRAVPRIGGAKEEPATSAAATASAEGTVETSERQTPRSVPRVTSRTTLPWPQTVGVVVVVFVVSLLFVTVVELIAGRPLADLFGHAGGGTTVEKIFETPATTSPPPTTTTTTTTSTSSSTETTSPSTTTTSTVGSTTSSSGTGSTTTTSSPTSVSGTSTTTTPPG